MGTKQTETPSSSLQLSVFPLPGVVLFPRALMPLNIFEPRYLDMVRHAQECSGFIAMSPRDPRQDPGLPIVVGYGRPEIVHQRADGTMVILLVGVGKAQLGDLLSDTPFLRYEAEVIEERSDVLGPNRFALNRLRRLYASWLEESLPQRSSDVGSLGGTGDLEDAQRLIEAISMNLLHTPQAQQQVLEINDVNDRIAFLRKHLLEKVPTSAPKEEELFVP